ncbi:hypothetical protein HJG60_010899 [Phyllostomus discolor]|uniref:Transmembrane protein 14C n=1 Tax=Phyllostomus discolor TaxID=89673 RepID=A0A834AC72_9CHIR|nr:hypothetical protein HJG60_010899 [Phyllostomus discolor]
MQKDSGPLVPLHWIGFGYAALVASGGIIGYAKAGSVPSLAAGLLFGGLAGLGAYQLSQDPRNVWVFLGMSASLSSQLILYPEDFTRGLVGCVRLLLPSPREVFKWGVGGLCWFLLIFYVHNMKWFSFFFFILIIVQVQFSPPYSHSSPPTQPSPLPPITPHP